MSWKENLDAFSCLEYTVAFVAWMFVLFIIDEFFINDLLKSPFLLFYFLIIFVILNFLGKKRLEKMKNEV